MTTTRERLTSAVIQRATIVDVDCDRWVVTARSAIGGREFRDVRITSQYTHRYAGEGIHVMPEVGAEIWVGLPSEGDARPFIVGFTELTDETGSARGNRPFLAPGDMVIEGRDGNFVRVYRGGMLTIGASALAQTTYLPDPGTINHVAEQYRIVTLGGTSQWYVGDATEGLFVSDYGQVAPTVWLSQMKRYAEQTAHVVDFQMGQDTLGGLPDVFRLEVFQDGAANDASRVSAGKWTIDQSGLSTLKLRSGGSHIIYSTSPSAVQGVILSKTFLTDLLASLGEASAILAALGVTIPSWNVATPGTVAYKIAQSIASASGQGPYISTHLKSE